MQALESTCQKLRRPLEQQRRHSQPSDTRTRASSTQPPTTSGASRDNESTSCATSTTTSSGSNRRQPRCRWYSCSLARSLAGDGGGGQVNSTPRLVISARRRRHHLAIETQERPSPSVGCSTCDRDHERPSPYVCRIATRTRRSFVRPSVCPPVVAAVAPVVVVAAAVRSLIRLERPSMATTRVDERAGRPTGGRASGRAGGTDGIFSCVCR